MFRTLFLLFLLVPAVELYVLIKVGGVIGALPTILLTVFTAVLGAYLMRVQGVVTMQKVQRAMMMGQSPQQEAVEGVFIFLGGVMLLIPGLVTDMMGGLFLIPSIRAFLAKALLNKMAVPQNRQRGHTYDGQAEVKQPDKIEVIEAEWVEIQRKNEK